jgi:septal ring factor EnvC (AmiA/AmiB activator)
MSDTKNQNQRVWRFDRRINLSMLIQLTFLASLIVGSWVNLQRQLDSLQRDVTSLLESQKRSADKVETLQEKVISHEFRLKQLEKNQPE